LKMLKPKNPEVGVWKENARRKDWSRWKPTSSFLIEKYTTQQRGSVHSRLGGRKRERSPRYDPGRKAWTERQYHGQQEPIQNRKGIWETTKTGDGINTETRVRCIMRARPAELITRRLTAACRWEDPQAGKRRTAPARR
jgi:hypothetical protein